MTEKKETCPGICLTCQHYHAIEVIKGMGQCLNWKEVYQANGNKILLAKKKTLPFHWPSMYDPMRLEECNFISANPK